MQSKIDYSLYLCTDRYLMSTQTIEKSVELAIKGGCTVVQLREKNCSTLEFYQLALRVKQITARHRIPLIINDRVDIALAIDAEGVHVGQSDLPASIVRHIIGPHKILGISTSNRKESIQAVRDGADYIGVGAMYSTDTKTDAQIVTLEELKSIRDAVNLPIVVIGGINKSTVHNFKGFGIDGLAVVSAIIEMDDISAAAQELIRLFKE